MTLSVAIVDPGMGNLHSVGRACVVAGMQPFVTQNARAVEKAEAVILPGVGAFPDAIRMLRRNHLDVALRAVVDQGKPLLGICLGLQLFMEGSEEFGGHEGLALVEGTVVRFRRPATHEGQFKVPFVGWNGIRRIKSGGRDPWRETPLDGLADDESMYFVHSLYAIPADRGVWAAVTYYEGVEYCSAIHTGSIFGCQFHPERSGDKGLGVYRSFRTWASLTPRNQPRHHSVSNST